MSRSAWTTPLLGLLAGLGFACADRVPDRPRLVVLYAPCTVRAPSLAPYDPSIPFTPRLAEFAKRSIVFDRHVTEAGGSGTAFASIFSGTQADRHGVYRHPSRLREDLELLAEAFAADGYETWFWSGHPMASASLGYGQGVPPERTVVAPEAERPDQYLAANADALTANDARFEALLEDLAAHPEKRAYVQVNFTLSHDPYHRYCTRPQVAAYCRDFHDRAGGLSLIQMARYQALYDGDYGAFQWDYDNAVRQHGLTPEEQAELATTMRVFYETAIRQVDRLFGAFVAKIEARGLLEDSVIAFTADHGEVLDRDNAVFRWSHGLRLAPEALDVPLLVCAPGRLEPGRYEGVSRSIDVYPTLAGLCGVAVPASAGVEGVDLSPALRGEVRPPELLAFSHTTLLAPAQFEFLKRFETFRSLFPSPDPETMWVSVRSGDLVCKLRSAGEGGLGFELYDLAHDPEERRDLFDAEDPRHAELARRLEDYKAKLLRGIEASDAAGEIGGDEQLRRLRSLGYVK